MKLATTGIDWKTEKKGRRGLTNSTPRSGEKKKIAYGKRESRGPIDHSCVGGGDGLFGKSMLLSMSD